MIHVQTIETVEEEDLIDPKILWIGKDDRGVELKIIAVVEPRRLLVIHVMPTHYRRRKS